MRLPLHSFQSKKKRCVFLSSFSLFLRTRLLCHVFPTKTVVATLSRSSLQDVLSHWLSLSYYLLFKGALSLTVFLFKGIAAVTSPRRGGQIGGEDEREITRPGTLYVLLILPFISGPSRPKEYLPPEIQRLVEINLQA